MKPSARRVSREFALQGLYQWQLAGTESGMTIAHRLGGLNTVPSFEDPKGAFREVRFKYNADGTIQVIRPMVK